MSEATGKVEKAMPAARKSNKSKRRKSETVAEKMLSLLARSADGVFAVDADQQVISWSSAAEELTGQRARDVIGKPCYEVVAGADYQGQIFCRRNCPTIRSARRGQSVPNFDLACNRNGEETWLNVTIIPVPSSEMGEAMAIHLIRDVSQRRRAERLAQAAIDTVSHYTSGSPGANAEAGPYPPPGPSLTVREIEVLRLLTRGLPTRLLAEELGLSQATIRNHIQRLLPKLGVHSRLEAVAYAARHGLI